MILLRKPSPDAVRAFLASQAGLAFSYPAVGATAAVPPAGYAVDHTRVRLGGGRAGFESAKAALGRGGQVRLGRGGGGVPGPPVAGGGGGGGLGGAPGAG